MKQSVQYATPSNHKTGSRRVLLEPYQVMDTPAETAFDDIARLATRLCDAPIAFITFVDDERQFFKASIGAGEDRIADLKSGFCPFTVASKKPVVIPNTLADQRYATNPSVVYAPFIRAYAGVPLCSADSDALGALCIVDDKPRDITENQVDALRMLARQIESLLELRRLKVTDQKMAQAEAQENADRLRLAMEAGRLGAFSYDLATGRMDCTEQCKINFGVSPQAEFPYEALLSMIDKADLPEMTAAVAQSLEEHTDYAAEYRIKTPVGEERWIAARGVPTYDADGTPTGVIGITQDITKERVAQDILKASKLALQEREQRIRSLYELTSRTDLAFKDKVHLLLELGRRWLGMGCAALARIDFVGETYEIIHGSADDDRFANGFKTRLEYTTCSETTKMSPESAALAFEHAGAHEFWSQHPSYKMFGTEAYIASVVWGNKGRWGTLAFFSQAPRPELFTEFDKDMVRLMAQWIGGEIARQETEAELRLNTIQQRRFVREMLASVTEGKLCLCDTEEDLPERFVPVSDEIVLTPTTIKKLRNQTDAALASLSFSPERTQDLITAVGEAAMNAVRHAGGGIGRVYIDTKNEIIQVIVQDQGKGIREEDLHRATLEKGWSGTDSFGHGFFLMLRTVDRTYLLTGASGTTVVLEQSKIPPAPIWWQSL